jgi:hypothetical protein
MAYKTTVKSYLDFDALPLEDAIGNTVSVSSGSAELVPAIFGNGYQMQSGQYLDLTPTFTSGDFTIGFWLKPTNPGMVTNPTTHIAEALRMPIISKSNFVTSSGSWIASSQVFQCYEKTRSDGQNEMVVVLDGLTAGFLPAITTVTTQPYSVDKFHHFAINYNTSTDQLTIYVDLVLDSTTAAVAFLSSTSAPMRVNYLCQGAVYAVARNQGVLDDLFVVNANLTLVDLKRIANMGAPYWADDDLDDIEETHQAILFDDPSTVQITSVFANRGNLYVGRTDGKLVRGVRSLWESRKEFSDERELEHVEVVKKSADTDVSVTNGVLKLQNEVIRI